MVPPVEHDKKSVGRWVEARHDDWRHDSHSPARHCVPGRDTGSEFTVRGLRRSPALSFSAQPNEIFRGAEMTLLLPRMSKAERR